MEARSALTVALSSALLAALVPACASGEPEPVPIAAEDVSILFPLPTNENDRTLLDFRDVGRFGRILPQYAIDALPPLANEEQADWAWTQLRVVGIRVDPCFAGTSEAPSCRNQLRLIWQPLQNTSERGDVSAMDAAVHSTYEVPRDDLVAFVNKVRALGGRTTRRELGIHSVLAEQGLEGEFAKVVKAGVLEFIGESRLTRVGFMTLPVEHREWVFGVFDVRGGKTVPAKPVGLQDERQTLTGSTEGEAAPTVRVSSIANEDVRAPLAGPEADITSEQARAAYRAALRLENPLFHTPETTDCASCHLASSARMIVLARWKFEGPTPEAFVSTLTTPARTSGSFRGFGYFGRQPSISDRAEHETEVARALLGSILAEASTNGVK